ncbi:MAG: ATP-binding protein [Candidatus Omnitrophota bacterium]|jgi:DNA replication protein DnaC
MNKEKLAQYQFDARVNEHIRNSRVPIHTRKTRRLKLITSAPENATALKIAKEFLDGKIIPPLFLIIGVPGVGKTTIAYAVAWEFLEEGLTVQYWQTEELLNELQYNMDVPAKVGSVAHQVWRQVKDCDLLILDDISAQNRTTWRDSQLDALVDYRYRENAPLIMTANKVDILTERITDRIKEGRTAMITGRSWRGRKLE